MDMSSAFFTQSSDSEFCHISSPEATSPASFMDFSPSAQLQNTSSTSAGAKAGFLLRDGSHSGRTCCKNPSKQRQSASEKEKLRMRDLTKALHHLRTYLPASVAPAGQTLTKTETLRLTIRYISYLSAQLGLSEESLRASESPLTRGYSTAESQSTFRSSEKIRTEMDRHQVLETAAYDDSFSSSSESLLECPLYADTATTYQGYSKSVHCPIAPEFWG